jgi:hypothetical protein
LNNIIHFSIRLLDYRHEFMHNMWLVLYPWTV